VKLTTDAGLVGVGDETLEKYGVKLG
jgi:hypothetical protein